MAQSFFRTAGGWLLAVLLLVVITACSERPPEPRRTQTTPPRPSVSQDYASMQRQQRALPPIQYAEPKTTVKIGLLLPLTGESAQLGKMLQDAAVMALFDKYATLAPQDIDVKVILVPKDTGSTPEQAAKAAREALDEGVQLLIGPVFSPMVSAVAPVAQERNVSVISLSNNRMVAGNGVYIFGFMPEQQVARVVDFALSRKLTRMGALLPQNAYGVTVQKAMMETLAKQNLRITPMEYYPPDFTDLNSQLARIARVKASANYPEGYKALLIAEGGAKLQSILQGLSTFDVTNQQIQFLGTGLWDEKEMLRMPLLMGGWFASSPPHKYQAFEVKFTRHYGYAPARLASLSYDAVALAASLAMAPDGPDFGKEAITDVGGYSGPANGIFRFHGNGLCERGLAVLAITPTGFDVIDPAPDYFGG